MNRISKIYQRINREYSIVKIRLGKYYGLFLRCGLVMLISFLSLSCSAKRELKLALDIPVNHTKPQDESLKIGSCSDYQTLRRMQNVDEAQSISGGFALLPTLYTNITLPHLYIGDLVLNNPQELGMPLPLFILHEQYRL